MEGCLIYFTDSHFRLSRPRMRWDQDDILEVVLTKMTWIIHRAEQLKACAIVCGGDIGHLFDWTLSMVNRVARVFKSSKIPIYTIIGNHDCQGRHSTNIEDTGIAMLQKLGAVKIIYEPTIAGDFMLHGFHSDDDDTEDLINGRYIAKLPRWHGFHVAVAHAPVGPHPATLNYKSHKEVMINGFDFALFGDIHLGWEPYESLTGCVMLNPGTLFRQKIDERDLKPRIAIIEPNGDYRYEEVPHKPAKQVFAITTYQKIKDDLGKGYLARLNAAQLAKDVGNEEYIRGVAKGVFSKKSVKILVDEIKNGK